MATPSVAEFDEPGGISYADGILYVADTNNHVIRAIDLEAGIVDTLEFSNPEALVIDADALTLLGGNRADDARVELDTQLLTPGAGTISLQLNIPDNYKINPLIDSRLRNQLGRWRAVDGSRHRTRDKPARQLGGRRRPAHGRLDALLLP